MKKMAAAVFKAKCLSVVRQVRATGEPVIVTRHGKPDVKLTSIEPKNDELFSFMRGKIKVVGDIESPVPVAWKVMKLKKKK